jgi:hypothetical protein
MKFYCSRSPGVVLLVLLRSPRFFCFHKRRGLSNLCREPLITQAAYYYFPFLTSVWMWNLLFFLLCLIWISFPNYFRPLTTIFHFFADFDRVKLTHGFEVIITNQLLLGEQLHVYSMLQISDDDLNWIYICSQVIPDFLAICLQNMTWLKQSLYMISFVQWHKYISSLLFASQQHFCYVQIGHKLLGPYSQFHPKIVY